MGGWEAASAGEVGGVGVFFVAVDVPVYCCNGVFNILPNSSGMYVGGWVNRDSRQKCGGSVGLPSVRTTKQDMYGMFTATH